MNDRNQSHEAMDETAAWSMAKLTSPRGSLGEAIELCTLPAGTLVTPALISREAQRMQPIYVGIDMGRDERGTLNDPPTCGLAALGEAIRLWMIDEEDRAEIERINLRPHPSAPARLTPFGAEPWDMEAGEAP